MIGRDWKVGAYHFYSASEYDAALRDQKLIDSIHNNYNLHDLNDVDKLYEDISKGKYRFETVIGRDFDDEIYEARTKLKKDAVSKLENKKTGNIKKNNAKEKKKEKKLTEKSKLKLFESSKDKKKKIKLEDYDKEMQKAILYEMKKNEQRRKWVIVTCSILSLCSIGYFTYYINNAKNSDKQFNDLAELKDSTFRIADGYSGGVHVKVNKTTGEETVIPDVLSEYQTLYSKNKKLIGWLKIADTVIDYPVMQTVNNEYYLKHNFNQEEDKNGCIFMDYQCDAINRSDNLILYGHHMQSGNMFGSLIKYQDEEYEKEHSTIQFDTIYEKGTYEVMYVFRSRVYSEEDVSFKYYQFINANSAKEFNSYMNEMASISFYDTGVTANYGDQLLTLSTCDYEENAGRFVVVCKRVK